MDSSGWVLPHLARQSDLFEKSVDFCLATNCCVFQMLAQARPGDQAWGCPLLLKALHSVAVLSSKALPGVATPQLLSLPAEG